MAISKITTGSISDSVAIDTDTLVVDGVNNRVGIGTSSPAQNLHIESTSASVRQRFVTGTTNQISIDFGDTDSGTVGRITYDHYTDAMAFQTNASERLRIDSAGRVTMPYQPSFAATRNQGDVSNAVYVYTNVYHNTGGHYNNSNGRFTAPVTGSYFISANHMTSNGATYNNYEYYIRVNGSLFQTVYSSSGGNLHHRWNWHGVLYLQAGDYVDVFIPAGFSIYGQSNVYQHFSGYLIG
jgi:hypothetical protein